MPLTLQRQSDQMRLKRAPFLYILRHKISHKPHCLTMSFLGCFVFVLVKGFIRNSILPSYDRIYDNGIFVI